MRDDLPDLRVGASIRGYRILQKPGARDPSVARPLGSGGTSFVYLVEQTLGSGLTIPRALKLFAPKESIRTRRKEAEGNYGEHHFLDEIAAVSAINHQHIVKIIDAGEDDVKRPFFVMEYMNCPTLEDAIGKGAKSRRWTERAKRDPYVVIAITQQICLALAYLHANRRFHFDIAPKNIFLCLMNDRPHVVLGDLGVSRSVPKTGDIPGSDGVMFIAGTREYTPDAIQPFREKGEIPTSVLSRYAAHWDLYALAKLALEMISAWGLDGNRELAALKIVCARALSGEIEQADILSSELERLLPTHVLTAGVEEISSDAYGRRKYISIPLQSVSVSRRVEDLIGHPSMTRLQLVPQLLLYRSVTPGGVHTVFEHVLGAYGNTLKCITKLLSQPRFRASFSTKQLEETLLTVLLSKLTTFPLDRILYGVAGFGDGEQQVLLEETLDSKKDGGESLRGLAARTFKAADVDVAVQVLTRPAAELTEPYQKLISSLVRSSIDVRVMDYLVRDSFHSGIPAGAGIDVNHIIDSLFWSEVSDGIGITRAGVFSVEHLLCARYWMFARLYWNQPNRSIAAMLRHVVHGIISGGHVSRSYLARQLSGIDESGALAVLQSHWQLTGGHNQEDATIINLLRQPRPRAYKLLVELFSRNWVENDRDRSLAALHRCAGLSPEELEALSAEFCAVSRHSADLNQSSVLFDVPQESPLKLGEDIYVEIREGEEKPLSEASDIVRLLPETFFDTVRLRAFCHPNLSRELRLSLADEVREFLSAKFLPR